MSGVATQAVAGLREDIRTGTFEMDPFPYLVVEPALDAALYDQLEETFPSADVIAAGNPTGNNRVHLLNAIHVIDNPDIPPIWRDAFRELASEGFFRDALSSITRQSTPLLPLLEERLGRPLDQCSMVMRNTGEEADLYFDVQLGINSAVTKPSRVRSVHIDNPIKIFNALLYMRHPDDQSTGGDLAIYKWTGQRKYKGEKGVAISDNLVEETTKVTYEKNKLVLFQNSPDSIHGVTTRSVTPIVRRYINFLLEVRMPLFEIDETEIEVREQNILRNVASRIFGR